MYLFIISLFAAGIFMLYMKDKLNREMMEQFKPKQTGFNEFGNMPAGGQQMNQHQFNNAMN